MNDSNADRHRNRWYTWVKQKRERSARRREQIAADARWRREEPPQRPRDRRPPTRSEQPTEQPTEDQPRERHRYHTEERPPRRDQPRFAETSYAPRDESPPTQPRRSHDRRRNRQQPRVNSHQQKYGGARRRNRTQAPPEQSEPRDRRPREHPHRRDQFPQQRRTPTDRRDYHEHPRERSPPVDGLVDQDILNAFKALEFENDAQKRIYRYIERHGGVSLAAVEAYVDLSPDRVTDTIQRLEEQGYIEVHEDDTLRIAHNTGVEEKHRLADVDVTIRSARQEDLMDLVSVIRAVTAERPYIVAESVAAQLAYEESVIRHTDVSSRMFFVATVDAEDDVNDDGTVDSPLIGWAHLTLPEIDHLDHTAELTIGVLKAYRRAGIGTHLMRMALTWAAANGYRKVHQRLPRTNWEAIAFLEAHGWDIEAIRANHYKIGDEFVDEVMMAVML